MEIVQQRMAVEGEYLFSGKSGGAMVSMDSWVTELRMRMRVRGVTKQWHIHDLRRTAATRLLAHGTPMPIISALLGHISLGSAKVYARADVEMVRAALMRSG
jgi:integrase